MKHLCILRQKRLCHVQSIQPHLVGIYFFVPIPSLIGSGMGFHLVSQLLQGFEVLGLPCYLIQCHQDFAIVYIVDIIVRRFVGADISFFIYIKVHRLLDVLKPLFLASNLPNLFNAF